MGSHSPAVHDKESIKFKEGCFRSSPGKDAEKSAREEKNSEVGNLGTS